MGGDDTWWWGLTARWSGPHTILAICIGSYFAVRFSQVLVGSIAPLLLESFSVSRGMIGLAFTGMWIGYAVAQLPSGVLADRFGDSRVIVAALLVTAAAAVGLARAPTFLLLGVGLVGMGVGAGSYYNPATTLLSREFDRLGTAIGSHRIGGQLAGVLAPVVAAVVTVEYGWRPVVGIGASLAVIAAALFVWWHTPKAPRRGTVSLRKAVDPDVMIGLLIRPHTRNTTFMMTLVDFVELAAMAFLPILLIEHFAFAIDHANVLFAVFFAVSAISQPVGGWLSDRFGRDATLISQMTAGVLGYGALAIGGSQVIAIPAVVLAGAAMSGTPVLQSRMIDGLAAANHGRGFGLFRTSYLLAGALGTVVVGVTADAAGWRWGFGLLAGLLGLVLLAVIVLPGRAGPTAPGADR